VLDIEGTTTPISFVHDVLFPYARARIPEFLGPDDIERLRAERAAEQDPDAPRWDGSGVAYAAWLTDRDRKSTALKALQGKIWAAGYRSGDLRSVIYPDVAPALARWHGEGRVIAIFSSGSVQAQRDLFAHTPAGDLTKFIDAYFDTTTGPKADAESYRRIAAALGRSPADALFVSDVVAELDAARQAGMATALCVRDDAARVPGGDHPVIRSFEDLRESTTR
jgi:enolase-phosphatase E1